MSRRSEVDLPALRGMEPYTFEHFVAELWSLYGWDTSVSQRSGDMGVDVDAHRPADDRRQSIQVKRYAADNTVGVGDVRQYAALDRQDEVDESVIVTTSSFTSGAVEAGEELGVTLIDGEELMTMVRDADGGVDLARRYLRGEATLAGRYRASSVVTGGPRPTRWWFGAVGAGLLTLGAVPVVLFLQASGAVGGPGRAVLFAVQLLGGVALGFVSVWKVESVLAGARSAPGFVRRFAGPGFSLGMAVSPIVLFFGVVELVGVTGQDDPLLGRLVLAVLALLGVYPLGVAGLYWRVRGELQANELTAEIDSVSRARDLLPNGGHETVAAAQYLHWRATDSPDEVVPAVPELVEALDDPDAADHAAAVLAAVAREFPEQVVDHLDAVHEAFRATEDRDMGTWLASTVAAVSQHDRDRVGPVAAAMIEALPSTAVERRPLVAPALPQFAATYPDLVGRHVETVFEIAVGDRPAAARLASEAITMLAGAKPAALEGLVPRLTETLAADPGRPGADELFTALSYLAALVDLDDRETRPSGTDSARPPDPLLRARLSTLAGDLGTLPAVRRRQTDAETATNLSTAIAFGPTADAVAAGLSAADDATRRRTWWFVGARAATDPSVLAPERTITTLKEGTAEERELAAVAVARAAATDPDAGRRYVPSVAAVLERGTQAGIHGDLSAGVADACLRALGSVGHADPASTAPHVAVIAAYLDDGTPAVVAAAAAALAPIAEHSPERVADHRDRLRTLADDDGAAGRAAAATVAALED